MTGLDYHSALRRTLKARIGKVVMVIAVALLAAGLLVPLVLLAPLGQQWIAHEWRNEVLGIAAACCAVGAVAGVVAGIMGRPWGYIVAALGVLGFIMMPSFMCA